MDEIEFFETIIVRMGGSFVEVEPNHFIISYIPHKTAIDFIKRFGGECLIEYRPVEDNLYDRVSARIENKKNESKPQRPQHPVTRWRKAQQMKVIKKRLEKKKDGA